jgi:hypothetical protein
MSDALPHQSTLILSFGGGGRTITGEDISRLLLDGLPDGLGDIVAKLDEGGAVTGYEVTLRFPTPNLAAEAAFRLRDLLVEMEVEFDVG